MTADAQSSWFDGVDPGQPVFFEGMPEDVYFAHPALSASGAKLLLPPSCPALYRWQRDHGEKQKRTFDYGKAAHQRVLGVGPEIVAVEAADWRTKAAQKQRDDAHAAGQVPLLAAEAAQVDAMADAIRRHPVASVLFDPERGGRPEVSLFWRDPVYEVDRRARLDWLPASTDGRTIVPDLKTCVSAEPGAFARTVANLGYSLQASWYCDAVRAQGLADEVAFVFVAIEKTPPYLITIFELDATWMRIGRENTERALQVFAECQATGEWPPYTSDVELLTPPAWLGRQYEGVLA